VEAAERRLLHYLYISNMIVNASTNPSKQRLKSLAYIIGLPEKAELGSLEFVCAPAGEGEGSRPDSRRKFGVNWGTESKFWSEEFKVMGLSEETSASQLDRLISMDDFAELRSGYDIVSLLVKVRMGSQQMWWRTRPRSGMSLLKRLRLLPRRNAVVRI
jgi:hypothetical protein